MWQEKNDSLYKKFEFKDFNEAFEFMTKVGQLVEEIQHHPTWTNTYNKVEIWLSTHDAGNKVTKKDKELAASIDEIAQFSTPDGKIRKVKLFGDGGSRGNPGPAASGYVILDLNDKVLKAEGVYLGVTTNNQAEYKSLLLGLKTAKQMGVKFVEAYMDSQLVVNQMNGVFKVKHRELLPLHTEAQEIAKTFEKISFSFVPREFNQLADAEVNKALDNAQ